MAFSHQDLSGGLGGNSPCLSLGRDQRQQHAAHDYHEGNLQRPQSRFDVQRLCDLVALRCMTSSSRSLLGKLILSCVSADRCLAQNSQAMQGRRRLRFSCQHPIVDARAN